MALYNLNLTDFIESGANITISIVEDKILINGVLAVDGIAKITVGTTEPVAPGTGDLWVDLN